MSEPSRTGALCGRPRLILLVSCTLLVMGTGLIALTISLGAASGSSLGRRPFVAGAWLFTADAFLVDMRGPVGAWPTLIRPYAARLWIVLGILAVPIVLSFLPDFHEALVGDPGGASMPALLFRYAFTFAGLGAVLYGSGSFVYLAVLAADWLVRRLDLRKAGLRPSRGDRSASVLVRWWRRLPRRL
jgi:hypothetical protein